MVSWAAERDDCDILIASIQSLCEHDGRLLADVAGTSRRTVRGPPAACRNLSMRRLCALAVFAQPGRQLRVIRRRIHKPEAGMPADVRDNLAAQFADGIESHANRFASGDGNLAIKSCSCHGNVMDADRVVRISEVEQSVQNARHAPVPALLGRPA